MNSGPVIHAADLPGSIWSSPAQVVTREPGPGIVPVADLEKQAILGAIAQLHGDKLTAARLLGIGKTTLYRKLKEYGENPLTFQR